MLLTSFYSFIFGSLLAFDFVQSDDCILSAGQTFTSMENVKSIDILPFRTLIVYTELECLQICQSISHCQGLNIKVTTKGSLSCDLLPYDTNMASEYLAEAEGVIYHKKQEPTVRNLILYADLVFSCISYSLNEIN